jgi:hypothetical protein
MSDQPLREAKPVLVLPEHNARCTRAKCLDKPGYALAARCRNCGAETHLLLTFGHSARQAHTTGSEA